MRHMAIFWRKFWSANCASLERRYGKSQLEYERNAVLAVTSIYGIDKLEENVAECRQRLFEIFERQYTARFKAHAKDECRDSVKYILERNIVHGDALTLQTVGPSAHGQSFSLNGLRRFHNSLLKRRDYTFLGVD